ncbi:hypothetical protein BJV85_003254 [Clostridium acetobutylicum]|uniref:Multimeric flavodoxin WrbA family protein, diverged or disrupted n=1 Tax=Clostridium acetobutylicum (strain ATCC 824 / DSM 792 / JCM 1419 / IAM 19013 / LMG 5710 / NBRC 13948 / NRRL B-527 / VKM B-1787 / 2291 / W) TaxID=272562 RepID=Q97L11_CLOAB|nr:MULTISPECIES: NAD(P)H-dependent oxidoreductase [Clostridium]AAK78731.1 Multimeric flavodoxin WrbA family protein, diverged or disrupted [Clostridium acetobutylicum ATCC 824]ADZ19805.1 Multimeric flavodoxin WrbA family protein, diverged or disrupted [Clostridium acetobutylicum EA 2018]AEI31419.1 multimeric flavodoxin WrbA family protein, diverged or disrupted [Clostridium acetobutylicum DSM 1731]AWV80449.1 flavodoxin [Clostridium acetobutylicum]MBC2392640.1 NAD(P)H-dependent oxidoreductase [
MKNICFINGSPRSKKANSTLYLNLIDKSLDSKNYTKYYIDTTSSIKGDLESTFKTLLDADYIILAFPLYVYSMPSLLVRFLEDYYIYLKNKDTISQKTNLYAVVNCGFPDAKMNVEALKIVFNCCKKLNINFRFGIGIGAGEFVNFSKNNPLLNKLSSCVYKSINKITYDIENQVSIEINNIFVNPKIPRRLFFIFGHIFWKKWAKRNGIKISALFDKPYSD